MHITEFYQPTLPEVFDITSFLTATIKGLVPQLSGKDVRWPTIALCPADTRCGSGNRLLLVAYRQQTMVPTDLEIVTRGTIDGTDAAVPGMFLINPAAIELLLAEGRDDVDQFAWLWQLVAIALRQYYVAFHPVSLLDTTAYNFVRHHLADEVEQQGFEQRVYLAGAASIGEATAAELDAYLVSGISMSTLIQTVDWLTGDFSWARFRQPVVAASFRQLLISMSVTQ